MMFVKYVGASSDVPLTRGRVYLARPAVEDHVAVDVDNVILKDDDDTDYAFRPDDEGAPFEFLDFVYAVVLRDCKFASAGDVVTLNGASDDGYYSVEIEGHYKIDCFEILDESNVAPGFWVLDLGTSKWERITRVVGCGWIAVGSESLRAPVDFAFPVSSDGIMGEPLVRCVDAVGESSLKADVVYRMVGWNRVSGIIEIEIDGEPKNFMESRFEMDV